MAKAKMKDAEVQAIVGGQIASARTYTNSGIDKDRDLALRFFNGEIDLPPMGKNRSKFVSRDVADTHGLIMPSLLRIFFGTDKIVIYEPTRKEHEEYAEQATDYVNYVVMRRCDGYRQFRDTFSDALLFGNGIIKHWWDPTPVFETEEYTKQTEDAYRYVLSEENVEEVKHEEYPDPDFEPPAIDPAMVEQAQAAAEMGDPQAIQAIEQIRQAMTPPMLHDFTIKRIKPNFGLRLAALPAEEFLLGNGEKVLDENVRFCAHAQRKTRSMLVKEGYPKDKVATIPASHSVEADQRSFGRDKDYYDRLGSDEAPDASTEYVDVYECYVLLDYDGDGIAERRRIVVAGSAASGTVLANEEWGDNLPFSDIVPDPRAHSWAGTGLFDELQDVQRIKSVAIRGGLDNMYARLRPTVDVEIDAYENPEAIMDPDQGEVFFRRPGKQPMQYNAPPSIADGVFPIMEYMDGVAEKRTGISQRSSTSDMDALQNQTATATNAVMAATHSKIEEYARNIANCGGMKRIFGCILKLVIKHSEAAEMVRLRGDWVEMDPRSWNSDMDVVINTGLGSGSREKDFMIMQGIAGKMELILGQVGLLNEDLNIGHYFMTLQKMAEAGGINNADAFFPTISQDRVKQLREQQSQNKQDDPAAKQFEAQMQMEQRKAEMMAALEVQKAQADQQLQQQKQQFDMQLERERNQMKIELERERAEATMALREQEAALNHRLKMREQNIEAHLAAQGNAKKAAMGQPLDTNIQEQSV
jgi:hypothetical protein